MRVVAFPFLSIVCNNISLLRLGVKVGSRHLVFDGLRKWTRFCDYGVGLRAAFYWRRCRVWSEIVLQLSLFLDSEDLLFTSIRSNCNLVSKSNPLADYSKV